MTDVSKTNEALRKALNVAREHFSAIAGSGEIQVWEDTGEKRGIDHQAKVWADRGARLASGALAATRVPVQGEPNDDRETLRDEFRSYLGDEIYVSSRDYSAWAHGTMGLDDFSLAADDDEIIESLVSIALSRSTVPDAATEAIDRVRAIHKSELVNADYGGTRSICIACERPYPCQTIAALDGAPEPEWEYQCKGETVPAPLGDNPSGHAKYCHGDIQRRRKAGPWLPVEGESK